MFEKAAAADRDSGRPKGQANVKPAQPTSSDPASVHLVVLDRCSRTLGARSVKKSHNNIREDLIDLRAVQDYVASI